MAPPRDTSIRYPGGRRALWGALGFIATYVVMVPVTLLYRETLLSDVIIDPGGGAVEEPITAFIDFSSIADWEVAGMLLFNAQMTPINVPIEVFENSIGGMGSVNFITTAGGLYLLLMLVPIVVYPITGMLATRDKKNAIASRRGYAAMMQFTGVVPLAIAAAFLFSFSAQGGTAGPSLLWTGFLVCFAYPAIGGFLGGTLAQKFAGSTRESSSAVDSWGT